MRFLTADWVFPLYKEPIKNGILCVSDDGRILDITEKIILCEGMGFKKICFFSYSSFDERNKQYSEIKYNYNKRSTKILERF